MADSSTPKKAGEVRCQCLGRWAKQYLAVLDEELCRVVGGSLVMYGYDGKPVARYHLEDAWSAAKAT